MAYYTDKVFSSRFLERSKGLDQMLVRTSSINFSDVAVVERGYKALVGDKKTEKEINNLSHKSRIFENKLANILMIKVKRTDRQWTKEM